MNILGISATRFDCGACLLQDNQIIATAQEERPADRGPSFPLSSLERCLKKGNIDLHDVDIIAMCDRPSLQLKRIMATALACAPTGAGAFLGEMSLWLRQQLWIFKQIFNTAGFKGKIIFPGRHQCLAAGVFFSAPFAEAAVLTMDEGGEWATTAYGTGSYNNISIMAEQFFPHSLDFFYSALLNSMGYQADSGTAEFVQLAERGEPRLKKIFLTELIDLKEDGSFRINMDYFTCCGDPSVHSTRFDTLLQRLSQSSPSLTGCSAEDLACSVRDVIEEAVVKILRHLQQSTGQKKLCMAGGSILNCIDKNRVLSASAFDELYMPPAAGCARGAVLFTLSAYLGRSLPVDVVQADPELLPC